MTLPSPREWMGPGLLLALALLGALIFTRHSGLPSFYDDSVDYLIMARDWTPWCESSSAIREAALREHYPPLFPLLLASSGAACDLGQAHRLVTLCFLVALGAVYRLALDRLSSRLLAFLVSLCFLLSPAVWINLPGILSENLYLALSLSALLLALRQEAESPRTWTGSLGLALLIAGVVLTRAIGITLLLAYGASLAIELWRGPRRPWLPRLLPLLLPLAALGLWRLLAPAGEGQLYSQDLWAIVQRLLQGEIRAVVEGQLIALHDAWFTSFLFYWTAHTEPRYLMVLVFGLLALGGVAWRLVGNHLDGWYGLFYLSLLLVWPYPGQFPRFLYGLLPVLMLQGLLAADIWSRHWRHRFRDHFRPGLILLLIVAVLPTLGFLVGRAGYDREAEGQRLAGIAEFYRLPDLAKAVRVARESLFLIDAMKDIRHATSPQARLYWQEPNYLNLLADRRGVPTPAFTTQDRFLQELLDGGGEYLLASHLVPKGNAEKLDGLGLLAVIEGIAEPLWIKVEPGTDRLIAVLLRLDRERLQQRLKSPPASP